MWRAEQEVLSYYFGTKPRSSGVGLIVRTFASCFHPDWIPPWLMPVKGTRFESFKQLIRKIKYVATRPLLSSAWLDR